MGWEANLSHKPSGVNPWVPYRAWLRWWPPRWWFPVARKNCSCPRAMWWICCDPAGGFFAAWFHRWNLGGVWKWCGSVSKPCTPVVHIKIAGKWMFIPLKMVLIGIDPYPCLYTVYRYSNDHGMSWQISLKYSIVSVYRIPYSPKIS